MSEDLTAAFDRMLARMEFEPPKCGDARHLPEKTEMLDTKPRVHTCPTCGAITTWGARTHWIAKGSSR